MKTVINYLIIFFLAFFCYNQKSWSQEKIKIGLILPLSGEYKEIGESIVKSTLLAINKINDPRIEILPRDTKSNHEITSRFSRCYLGIQLYR